MLRDVSLNERGIVLVVVVISLTSSRKLDSLFDLELVVAVVVVVFEVVDSFNGSRNSTLASCFTGIIRTLVIPVEERTQVDDDRSIEWLGDVMEKQK